MATITMEFPIREMLSIQIGDIAYYSTPAEVGGFQSSSSLTKIGAIIKIAQFSNGLTITCDIDNSTLPPTETDFILFAKDNRANATSLAGYFGTARFVNNSDVKAEMFAASCEIDQSSK